MLEEGVLIFCIDFEVWMWKHKYALSFNKEGAFSAYFETHRDIMLPPVASAAHSMRAKHEDEEEKVWNLELKSELLRPWLAWSLKPFRDCVHKYTKKPRHLDIRTQEQSIFFGDWWLWTVEIKTLQ